MADSLGGCLKGRLLRLFSRPESQLGVRTVRGSRTRRKRGAPFNPLSPKGDKHIQGKTDTGSDARCARLPRGEAKSMDPADLWDLMNSRISTCELEAGIRAAKLRPGLPALQRVLTIVHRTGELSPADQEVLERMEYALRSDSMFYESVNGLLNTWTAAFRDVKAGAAPCAGVPQVADKLAFIEAAMTERTAALRRKSGAAIELRKRVRAALDLVRPASKRSLTAEFK